ncbi:MAG: DUF3102 domain-containing protein [Myxococcales bacterium]|nr:DUF3102 domain-containing protein [Myxococcales bacterium]
MALRLTGKRRGSQKLAKGLGKGVGKALGKVPGGGTTEPPSALEALKGEILQLVGAVQADEVEARAEVGKRLAVVRAELPHGAWLPWVKEHLPFGPESARRAIQLHEFRGSQPEVFAKLRPLGLTKVYALLALGPKQRDELVGKRHVVPSTGFEKAPLEMTFAEMMEVLHPPEPETPITTRTRVLRGLRRQTQGLTRLLAELWALAPKAVARGPVRAALAVLEEELQAVASALAAKSLIAGRVPRFR